MNGLSVATTKEEFECELKMVLQKRILFMYSLAITYFLLCVVFHKNILNVLLILNSSRRKRTKEVFLRTDLEPMKIDHSFIAYEYQKRRENLFKLLYKSQVSCDCHFVFLLANDRKRMTGDVFYPFHQDTDFIYFTGLNIPDIIVVLSNCILDGLRQIEGNIHEKISMQIYAPQEKVSNKRSKDLMKVDKKRIKTITDLRSVFQKNSHVSTQRCFWYKGNGSNQTSNSDIKNLNLKIMSHQSLFNLLYTKNNTILELGYFLDILRLIKSDYELSIIRNGSKIIATAFAAVKNKVNVGDTLHKVSVLIEYECKRRGANFLSFPPITTAGQSTPDRSLHESMHQDYIIKDGDLLLLDSGCEYNGYSSDVTRTWPVSGRFTDAQLNIYKIVLMAHEKCINQCENGTTLDNLYRTMLDIFDRELSKLGLIKSKSYNTTTRQKEIISFCPHYIGHYIGLDVHDTKIIGNELKLQKGMVFTIEPGLYIPNSLEMPEKYRGIKIRIENIVAITSTGVEILTKGIPYHIEDL